MPANINGRTDEVVPPGAAFLPSRPVPDGREGACAAQSGISSQSAGPRRSRGKFCRRERHFFPHDPPTGREWEETPPNPPPHPPPLTSAERPPTPAEPTPSPAAVDVRPSDRQRQPNPPPPPPPLTSTPA